MPVKGVWIRIVTVARAVLHDLFGEGNDSGPGAAPGAAGGRAPAELDEIQARLDGLMPELVALTGRQKLLEAERRRAGEELDALDAQIDDAARQGADEQARALLKKRLTTAVRQDDLERRSGELAQTVQDTRASMDALRARLVEARRQAADLSAREQNAAALETLTRARRDLDRDLARLQSDMARRDEQAARTEDRIAAMKDLDRRGKP